MHELDSFGDSKCGIMPELNGNGVEHYLGTGLVKVIFGVKLPTPSGLQ